MPIGIWLALLGYTTLVWGERLFTAAPLSFGYLLGWSKDPGYPQPVGGASQQYLDRYGLTVDQVHALRVKATKEGKPVGYYLPGGPGWKAKP